MVQGKPRQVGKELYNSIQIPHEVWEKFGDFSVSKNGKYLYGHVPKYRLPRWVTTSRISIAKLVWLCHYPDHRFAPMEKLMYFDKDTMNNEIDNLTLGGLG